MVIARSSKNMTSGTKFLIPFAAFVAFDLFKGLIWPSVTGWSFFALDATSFILVPIVVIRIYQNWFGSDLRLFYRYALGAPTLDPNTLDLLLASLGATIFIFLGNRLAAAVGGGIASLLPSVLPNVHLFKEREWSGSHLATAIYYALTAGITEELMFRGVFKRVLDVTFKNATMVAYVLGSSITFAAVHFSHGLGNVVAAFLTGIMCSLAYAKIGDLRPVIFAHIVVEFEWAY
jgi:hypothetical protein